MPAKSSRNGKRRRKKPARIATGSATSCACSAKRQNRPTPNFPASASARPAGFIPSPANLDVDFLPGWKGSNPVNDLAREFGVRVALENDGDAAALGEAAWGAGKGKSRLIYVTVGTGIGGGIILEGRLYRGADKAHPEVGHHVIDASGPQCTCGFRGCWEALATGPALAAWFNAKAQAADPQARALTAKEIFQCARQGHPLACEAVARETYYLGLGLANLINLFVPERIVLGGSIMKSMRLEDLRKVIAQGCRFVPFEKTELALASLGDDANLIGAAQVWHHRFVPQAPAQGAA